MMRGWPVEGKQQQPQSCLPAAAGFAAPALAEALTAGLAAAGGIPRGVLRVALWKDRS